MTENDAMVDMHEALRWVYDNGKISKEFEKVWETMLDVRTAEAASDAFRLCFSYAGGLEYPSYVQAYYVACAAAYTERAYDLIDTPGVDIEIARVMHYCVKLGYKKIIKDEGIE